MLRRGTSCALARATDRSSGAYVEPEDRIAAFDNDGTLWVEKPLPVQFLFAFDRVRTLAPLHPEWQRTQPFEALLEGDRARLEEGGPEGLAPIAIAAQAGTEVGEFRRLARAWLDSKIDPRFERHPTELVYQPMIELMSYLRDRGFKTFICSGGNVDFMRAFTDESYGVPDDQVIGTSLVTEPRDTPTGPKLVFTSQITPPFSNYEGKPVNLQRVIGRMPVLAVGNSDGDLAMLKFATSGPGAHLAMLVHHDDAEREFAYDAGTEQALAEARRRGWIVVSMKRDFGTIFPPRSAAGR